MRWQSITITYKQSVCYDRAWLNEISREQLEEAITTLVLESVGEALSERHAIFRLGPSQVVKLNGPLDPDPLSGVQPYYDAFVEAEILVPEGSPLFGLDKVARTA